MALSFDEVQELFNTLGVQSFGAALPEGRIHWTNADGQTVAHGRCQAVLSWAAANDSIMWADHIPHFGKAGVPCLPAPDPDQPYEEGIDLQKAQELAGQAASLANAQFLYAAPMGGGSQLFLAVRDFAAGAPEEDADAEERRQAATRAWAAARLQAVVGVIGEDRLAEAKTLLEGLVGQARQQAEYVVTGTDTAERLEGLANQAGLWAESLEAERDRVIYEMGIAAKSFGEDPA